MAKKLATQWEAAKAEFTAQTNVKKPSPKFLGFRLGSGIHSSLKAWDEAIQKIEDTHYHEVKDLVWSEQTKTLLKTHYATLKAACEAEIKALDQAVKAAKTAKDGEVDKPSQTTYVAACEKLKTTVVTLQNRVLKIYDDGLKASKWEEEFARDTTRNVLRHNELFISIGEIAWQRAVLISMALNRSLRGFAEFDPKPYQGKAPAPPTHEQEKKGFEALSHKMASYHRLLQVLTEEAEIKKLKDIKQLEASIDKFGDALDSLRTMTLDARMRQIKTAFEELTTKLTPLLKQQH